MAPPIVDRYISDHGSVCCKLLPEKPPVKKKVLSYSKYKSIDLERFKSDLEASSLCLDHRTVETSAEVVDKLATDYNSTLSTLIDRYAPIKTKRFWPCPSVPCYTGEIGAAKRLRRKKERCWRRSGLREDFDAFKAQRNHVTFHMNAARKAFYTDFIMENASDQGRLFRAAKKLLSKKEAPSFPNYLDKTALTNGIGRFFIRKIKTIRLNIDAVACCCSNPAHD